LPGTALLYQENLANVIGKCIDGGRRVANEEERESGKIRVIYQPSNEVLNRCELLRNVGVPC